MKLVNELTLDELKRIDGGTAKPGPSTLVLEVTHAIIDYGRGFIDEFLRFSNKK